MHHFLCTEASLQELCVSQAGGTSEMLVLTELQVRRAVSPFWVLLRELFGNV